MQGLKIANSPLYGGKITIMNKKILIVDDDPHIRQVVSFALKKVGMQIAEAKNGREGLAVYKQFEPDLIILDITMPEMDGLEMCRELRKVSEVPILFLSALEEEVDKVVGLEIGGDDYVTKPFSPRELAARVNVILKRLQKAQQSTANTDEKTLNHGNIMLDLSAHKAYWSGEAVNLTATEFAILKAFLEHPNRVYKRENLINLSYDFADYVNDRTIDSHIRRIRNKFTEMGSAKPVIQTVHGVGYKLGMCL
jgi:two-component system, OmpR family, response regulator